MSGHRLDCPYPASACTCGGPSWQLPDDHAREQLHDPPCAWPAARCTCSLKLESTAADFAAFVSFASRFHKPQQESTPPMTERKTSTLRVNASTLAHLLLPSDPKRRAGERMPTVKVASIEGPPTEVEMGGTTLILDIEHDGGLPAGVFSLADLCSPMRRSFEWKYPELPDVSALAIAQELFDELEARGVVEPSSPIDARTTDEERAGRGERGVFVFKPTTKGSDQ